MKNKHYVVDISIIIPCYNVGDHIEQAIDSLLNQKTKRIFEIICIENGSTDNTYQILKRLQNKYMNINIIKNSSNMGAAIARNQGIERALGTYIAFLDGDDFYPNESVIENYFNIFEKYDVNVILGKYCRCTYDGKIIANEISHNYLSSNSEGVYSYEEFIHYGNFAPAVYLKAFIVNRQLEFPDYLLSEDIVFIVKVLSEAEKIYVTNDITYIYRKSSHRNEYSLEQIESMLDALTDLFQFVIASNHDNLSTYMVKYDFPKRKYLFLRLIHQKRSTMNKLKKLNMIIGQVDDRKKIFDKDEMISILNNASQYNKMLKRKIKNSHHVYIYGAGLFAERLVIHLKKMNVDDKLQGFIVTNTSENQKNVLELPVHNKLFLEEIKGEDLILLATQTQYHNEIKDVLNAYGINTYMIIDFEYILEY